MFVCVCVCVCVVLAVCLLLHVVVFVFAVLVSVSYNVLAQCEIVDMSDASELDSGWKSEGPFAYHE